MPWRQVLVTLLCTSLTVRSSPCSWVEVLSSWSQGYKAVVKLQMEETVDHWDVDVEFSEAVINFEAWKGHVNKISDTHYTVSNTCYNNMVYSCQCFELPYLVRHEPMWEGNTTFKFNGELVPTCEPPSCDDSSSGVANTTSTTQPAESLTTSELTANLNVVGNILNDLSSLRLKRYKRQSNGFTKDENELLNTLAEYTTYLKNECSTKSGSCQSKTLAAYGSKLNSIFQKVKNSGGISSGFVDAFKGKYEQLKEATKTAVDNQAENSCKANGKPCIFPFKDDAGKEHNTCADYKGKYFWCATRVNSKGKYVSWERCPDDGSCPPPKDEKTTTTTTTTTTPPPPPTKQPQQGVACMAGSKPCVFPFKDTDGTEYNECADYKGRYFWCATAVNSKGTFTNWGKCTECEDPNTTPSTPEDCSCTDYINKKGYGQCKKGHPDFNDAGICYVKLPSTCSDLKESKTDPGKMASAEACKKVDGDDSCCQELDLVSTGAALEYQGARLGSYKKQAEENDGKPVYLQEGAGGNYLFYRETFGWLISRQGPQSTSKGGIMSDSEADCPTDGGMKWKIYDRVTYDNIDSSFKLTCKGSDTTVSNHPTKSPGSCLANGKPCIFPFKDDDGTSYNGCPKYEGRYYWCATSLKTNGVYKVWEHCPEDGSCPLLPNVDSSTPAALPKQTTKPSESPETTPTVKWEPGKTSFYISDGNNNYKCEISFEFNVNKKTEFKAISSTCSESKKQKDVMQYVGKHNFSLVSKEGATLECFIGAAIARGDLCQTVLEDSLHCNTKSGSCSLTRADGFKKCSQPYIKIGPNFKTLERLDEFEDKSLKTSDQCIQKCTNKNNFEIKCIAYLFKIKNCGTEDEVGLCQIFKKATGTAFVTTAGFFCHRKCSNNEKLTEDNSCICGTSRCAAGSFCINDNCIPECLHKAKLTGDNSCICGSTPIPACHMDSYCFHEKCVQACPPGEIKDPKTCHCGGEMCNKNEVCVGEKCVVGCQPSTVHTINPGCACNTESKICPPYHMCTKNGCSCKSPSQNTCDYNDNGDKKFCRYLKDLERSQYEPCGTQQYQSKICSCSEALECPHPRYLEKHVRDDNWLRPDLYDMHHRAYYAAIERNYEAVTKPWDEFQLNGAHDGEPDQTIIFQSTTEQQQNYVWEKGLCKMTVSAPAYKCSGVIWRKKEDKAEILKQYNERFRVPAPQGVCKQIGKPNSICTHYPLKGGHFEKCKSVTT